ncbi:cytochrome P450 [Mycolicibacterium rhodesiae NBB3]|uniref:Cytochrome P450 n=1 Tax=Mycolicibacterium rhodesiae (strain NBB3) TaxID=710685 RepID=G8RL21_MYCRN|nr:cytochrome P450 [Mycolicibacterium rhodesiae]AEV71083.1 cytochrome P450 [Mycolicibacterium rhodesiae NBB3]
MSDLLSLDYFTDPALAQDANEYFDEMRRRNPVYQEPHYGVVAVTGYNEALAVFKNHDAFSACISIGGPFPPLPFEPQGDDIREQIEAHRHLFPIFEHMVTMDPPDHTRSRSLLNKLLTPKRLKENEDFLWQLVDHQLDEFIADGRCEVMSQYAKPFATLAIADLLGIPDEDRAEFRLRLGAGEPGSRVGALDHEPVAANPLEWLDNKFSAYISDRRTHPRDDVLSALASAKYPDDTTPELLDVVHPATFLFAAGQETVTKLLSAQLHFLAEDQDLQARLRNDRGLIGGYIEESLRLESPTKIDFRLTVKTTELGGVRIPAGTVVMICIGAANRDPAKFEDPHAFRPDRRNVREQIAFGRGIHSCAGAPLARVEGRITLERMLDRMKEITIDQDKHGTPDARRFAYEPTFLIRGLTELHIEFTPAR